MQNRIGWTVGVALCCSLAGSACQENGIGPRGTELLIQVTSLGGDLDADGYSLLVDGEPYQSVVANQTVRIRNLSWGTHTVGLTGVAQNCDLHGQPVREIALPAGAEVEVEFEVECFATGFVVSNTTSGIDFGTGYVIRIDGGSDRLVGINAATTISRLAPGPHAVSLVLDPSLTNCQVAPAEGYPGLEVTARLLIPVNFVVSCTARYGSINVSVEITGPEANLAGYRVQLSDGTTRTLNANGSAVFDLLAGGDYVVQLIGVPSHCAINGSSAPTVSVQTGGLTRHTGQVSFQVHCTELERAIAFTRWPFESPYWGYDPFVALAREDGSAVMLLTPGHSPAWSPDGTRLAYIKTGLGCYYGCISEGVHLVKRDNTGLVQLTNSAFDFRAVWSPAGDRIAFDRNGWIWLMNPDGTGQAPMPFLLMASSHEPAWSPDGTRLAFSCSMSPIRSDICTVQPDGTGLVTLTPATGSNWSPAWSPDGSRIVFVTTRFGQPGIAVMNADGSGAIRLADGATPTWSPDGTRILFSNNGKLHVMNADGSGLLEITGGQLGSDYAPAWRR